MPEWETIDAINFLSDCLLLNRGERNYDKSTILGGENSTKN